MVVQGASGAQREVLWDSMEIFSHKSTLYSNHSNFHSGIRLIRSQRFIRGPIGTKREVLWEYRCNFTLELLNRA